MIRNTVHYLKNQIQPNGRTLCLEWLFLVNDCKRQGNCCWNNNSWVEKFKNVEFRDLLWEPLTSITVPQVLRLKLRFMWMPLETLSTCRGATSWEESESSSPPTRSLGTDITIVLGSHWSSTAEDRGRGQGPRHITDKEHQIMLVWFYITAGFNQTM